ncbi:MAG: type III pantothenate kinase [Oscillospiraceae bacterium]|jgi:type III pantothenate kinase|nr:type III pantothenate kinase [Oscillospiraceae bacterium]
MLLTIDAGNSNITLGVYDLGREPKLRFRSRLATQRILTSDQLAVELLQVFRLHQADPAVCRDAVVSCVVTEMTQAIAEAAELLTGRPPLVLLPGVKTGLNIRIDNPAQLGSDLTASAVAAKAFYPLPCLVVDLGTATKISAVDARGDFLGCTIAAGVNLSLDALSASTSQLPRISFRAPERTIGTNTIDSMQSGTVFGAACMIDGMCARMERELGRAASVVATGGLARDIVSNCAREIIYDGELILRGLVEIYRRNRGLHPAN